MKLSTLVTLIRPLVCGVLVAQPGARAGLAEATDFSDLWTSDFWTEQAVTTIDGIDAAECTVDGAFPLERSLQTTIAGPTTLYFSHRIGNAYVPGVVTESKGLFLVVGGASTLIKEFTLAGLDHGWIEASAQIPAGVHTVQWKLSGPSVPSFIGTFSGWAYVDQVWTSDDDRPRITDASKRISVLGTPFSWPVPITSATSATLEATGLPAGLTVNANTNVISGTPTAVGKAEVTLTAHNAAGQHVAKVTFEVEPAHTTIGEGVEAPDLVFTQTSPETAWRGATGVGHDGVDCARGAASINPRPNELKALSATFNGPGALSFWYRCEGESSADRTGINLYVDIPPSLEGPLITAQLTATTWTKHTVPLPAGPQTISWVAIWGAVFGSSVDQRFVYLDEVEFAPSTVPPQSTFAAWRTAWNVEGQATSTDIDGDGLTLPMEYAFGGSPYVANPELLPVTSISDGYFTINVIKAPSPTDLLYFVQASKDLVPNSWTTSTVEVLDEDGTHIVARCTKPVSELPVSHLRVRVLVAP